MINSSDVCGPPKFLRSVYGLSSENPAVYGLSPVLSAVHVGEITVTVINNRNFSRSLKLISLINCARCETRRAISVCMQLCIYLSLCIDHVWSPEEVKNNGRLMWTAEETAGSKDLRSVYGPLPGPDRSAI